MKERYSRNRIYIREDEQELIGKKRLFLGGSGIGSVIAECAIRFGFENITIVDGDKVELSNLNRQNYTFGDIGRYKAECLAERLLMINPDANVMFHTCFIDRGNVKELLEGHDIAINALDFTSDIPFYFDEVCKEKGIPVLHPFNFGFGAFLTIVKPDSLQLAEVLGDYENADLRMVEQVCRYGIFWTEPKEWLERVIEEYKKEKGILPPPQLAIGSWIVAGDCVTAMYNMLTGKDVKVFPKFYLSTLYNNRN